MCGIATMFLRESVPNWDTFDIMFRWCEKRGVDGTGYAILRQKKHLHNYGILKEYKSKDNYHNIQHHIQKEWPELQIGDVVMMICRASPESEPATSIYNMQPIINHGCVLIHNGSVSQKIYNELQNDVVETCSYEYVSNIDSEAIIAAYVKNGRNMKKAMEYLSGGFAFTMADMRKSQLYVVNDFKPISTGYIKGIGYMVASDVNCLNEVIELHTQCSRNGMNCWEYFYANPQLGPKIRMIDLDSGFEKIEKFNPRYITNKWDSTIEPSKEECCLVACSGGLDSSCTLATLKYSGYKNIIACHFNYGHRGSEAEKIAITNVCNKLEIPLKVIDLSDFYKELTQTSMLLDDKADVRTGTDIALKTTEAWVPGRNMMFLTYMATLAESLVMEKNYNKVYLLGGFLNLAESGFYPDNSEDFLRSFLQLTKYGTLIGNRFEPLYCLSNLMKSEQWVLIKFLEIEEIIKDTISCDRPIVDKNGVPRNCMKNGLPACGSGALSYWAAKMVGMEDNRNFYEVDDDAYELHHAEHLYTGQKLYSSIDNIVDRILIPEKNKTILKNKVLVN